MTHKTSISYFLDCFYKFNTAANNTQAGFVELSTATAGVLELQNDRKTSALKGAQNDINAFIDNGSSKLEGGANKLSAKQGNLTVLETEWQARIQSFTAIVTAVQEQVKNNAQGLPLLAQIAESVLSIMNVDRLSLRA
jgi:hypothetical protein